MTTEKLSGSIWVSKQEWEYLQTESQYKRTTECPIELTITAKMPERKREFTEREIRAIIKCAQDGLVPELDIIFKDTE